MKKSQFIVEQEGFDKDSVLLYSTFTTSIVEIEKKLYTDIFELKLYDVHKEETEALLDMGFLVSDEVDELKFLETLRIKTIEANKTSPTYYIICPTTGCNARCYYCFEKGAVHIPRRVTISCAMRVARWISLEAPPETSEKMISSAARPARSIAIFSLSSDL